MADILDQKLQITIKTSAGEFVFKRLTPKERRDARTTLAIRFRNNAPVEQLDQEMVFISNAQAILQASTVQAPEGFSWSEAEEELIYEAVNKLGEWEQSFRK